MPYLHGLKEVLTLKLPDKAPDLPHVAMPGIVAGPTARTDEDAKRKREQALQALRQAEFEREMVMHRDVLTRQIAGLYGRRPFANREVEDLARQTLEDPAAVDRVMHAVQDRVARTEQIAQQKAGPAAVPTAPAPPSPLRRYLAMMTGAVLLAFVLGLTVRLFRRRGKGLPGDR